VIVWGDFRVSLNKIMMKAKLSLNLISFITVRRCNWILKVSVYKNKQIMVIAQHYYDLDRTIVKYFRDQNNAADFIEELVSIDIKDEENDSKSI
jgi:hypothetical protein